MLFKLTKLCCHNGEQAYKAKLDLPYYHLPEGMAATSTDIIANLNEHLLEVLQELSQHKTTVGKMEHALETSKREYAVLSHKQGLLYTQYTKETEGFAESKKTTNDKIQQLKIEIAQGTTYKEEFNAWQKALQLSPDELQMKVGDVARKSVVLKINQETLARRYTMLLNEKEHLVKDNEKLTQDVFQMERAVQERTGYLERFMEAADFRIVQMQDELDRSVDKSELDIANRKCEQLAVKYRIQLEQHNRDIEHGISAESLRHQVHLVENEIPHLRQKLKFAEEREAKLMQQLQDQSRQILTDPPDEHTFTATGKKVSSDKGVNLLRETSVLQQRIQTLDMQVQNEKQRNALLDAQLDRESKFSKDLQTRYRDLEKNFNKATEIQLNLQIQEQELRDQLLECVPLEENNKLREQVSAKAQRIAKLETEASELKKMSDIANQQTRSLEVAKKNIARDNKSLYERCRSMEAESDERVEAGKLHRLIIQLQVSEAESIRRLDNEHQQRLETLARLHKVEKQLDERNDTLRRIRTDAKTSRAHCQHKLQDMRQRYLGAVTLEQQEKFTTTFQEARQKKAELEAELEKAANKTSAAGDQLKALELKHMELQELLRVTKDGKGAVKIAEWHQKMVDSRVSELHVTRKLTRATERVLYLESIVETNESRIQELEVEVVEKSRDCETRQMKWEERESRLEVKLEEFETDEDRKSQQLQSVMNSLNTGQLWQPDPAKSMPDQLTKALYNLRLMAQAVSQEKKLRQASQEQLQELRETIQRVEGQLLQRDSLIMDLRLQCQDGVPGPGDTESDTNRRHALDESALRIAQETITSMQSLLRQKEQAGLKTRQLLSQSHHDAFRNREKHAQELQAMAERVNRLEAVTEGVKDKPPIVERTDEDLERVDKLVEEIAVLQATLAERDQQLRAFKTSTTSRHSRLAEQKDAVIQESESLRRQRDEYELRARNLELEKATVDERLSNALLAQDEIKSRLLAEKQSIVLLKEHKQDLQEQLDKQGQNVKRRDTTIKKLKSEMSQFNLQSGLGFGSKSANPTALSVDDALSAQAGEMSDRLSKLQTNQTKAQALIKRQKEKYAESERIRQRLDVDLTKWQKLARKHEEELTNFQVQAQATTREYHGLRSELALRDVQVRQKESELKRIQESLRTLQTHAAKGEGEGALVARLQKRIRVLESRARTEPAPPPKVAPPVGEPPRGERRETERRRKAELDKLRTEVTQLKGELAKARRDHERARDKVARDDTDNKTLRNPSESRFEQWEVDKKRQKQMDTLKAKVGDQTKALTTLNEQNESLKDTVRRLDREKNSLQKKVAKKGPSAPRDVGGPAEAHAKRGWQEAEALREELQGKVKEMVNLQNQIKSLELENHQLLEQQSRVGSARPVDQEIELLTEKADNESRRRLDSENQNFTLKVELEQLRAELARLQAKKGSGGPAPGATVSNVKYMELVKANKRLKKELESATQVKSRFESDSRSLARVADQNASSLKADRELLQKAQKKVVNKVPAACLQPSAVRAICA